MHPSPRKRAGYTLIEMAIVVAIIGIVAAIAIPTFTSHMQRTRTTEVFSVIGEIREAQNAYYATFSRYAGPQLTWNPAIMPVGGQQHAFNPGMPGWNDLGADPDGVLRFQYRVFAGAPGTVPADDGGPIPGFSSTAEHWYVVQAQGDLDGDGNLVGFETYSAGRGVFVSRGIGGAYLAQGWE